MNMKKIILFLTIFLSACTGHYEADDFNLDALNKIAPSLFELNTENGQVEVQWWPEEIQALKPKLVKSQKDGIYIVLDSIFISESGIFIPREKTVVVTGKDYDPSYILLGGNVYSYHIKG